MIIQSRPYEFMAQYTPQRQWIEGQGLILFLAFFFVDLGAGSYLVSLSFGSLSGMLTGWILCAVLGCGFHLFYLGRPMRAWRMLLKGRWRTSWIARGMLFVTVFLILGVLHMALLLKSSPNSAVAALVGLAAFCTVVYVGFVMSYANGVQLWNTALLPLLFAVSGLWGGLGVTILSELGASDPGAVAAIELWSRIFLVGYAFILPSYLITIRYQGEAASESAEYIMKGKLAPLFWGVVVLLGVVLPVIVAAGGMYLGWHVPANAVRVTVIAELAGDLALRFCLLKAALYKPLVPNTNWAY